jgi:hypothetical protein
MNITDFPFRRIRGRRGAAATPLRGRPGQDLCRRGRLDVAPEIVERDDSRPIAPDWRLCSRATLDLRLVKGNPVQCQFQRLLTHVQSQGYQVIAALRTLSRVLDQHGGGELILRP